MAVNQGFGHRIRFLLLGLICVSVCSGCSVATGDMLTFFPQREELTRDAKNIRNVQNAQGIPPVPRELNKAVLPAYLVAPGVGLLIQPADLDSEIIFTPDQTVLADGTIHLGKYGQIVVAGKAVGEIQMMVQGRVNAFHKKDMGAMVVQVVVPDSKVFYVLGEVNAPGSYPLKGRETVLDGILAAGGLNARASHTSIILSRPTPPDSCRVVLPVCYDQIVQLGDTATNYQLRPGDRIFVASRTLAEDLFPHLHKRGLCNGPQLPCDAGCASEPDGTPPHAVSVSSPPVVIAP